MKRQFFIIVIISLLFSCTENASELIECPEAIAKNALMYATEYSNVDTEYSWGGREPLRSIKIDCSGLVVNCYQYAVNKTQYSLPFQDATVFTFFSQWSVKTDNPRQGDLIFMGDNKNNPTHMSLFVKEDDAYIFFIDSSLKPEDNINGVSERFYPKDDNRFLSFGRLLLHVNKSTTHNFSPLYSPTVEFSSQVKKERMTHKKDEIIYEWGKSLIDFRTAEKIRNLPGAVRVNKTSTTINTTDESVKNIIQPTQEDNISEKNLQDFQNSNVLVEETVPLLIGGRQYRGQLGERVEVEKGSWRIPNDPVNCTVDDIDKLIIVSLWVDPENPERRNSLENLELLQNIKELWIGGQNLDKVDFSPIASQSNLEKLEIEGNIARLPDLTRLEKLNKIEIKKATLESLEGRGAPNVETINIEAINGKIDSFAPLNNLLMLESLSVTCFSDKIMKVSDMTNLPGLKMFTFKGKEIDMRGIEQITSLEHLMIYGSEPFNLEEISRLNNLKMLYINLMSDNPSIDFLKNMPSLTILEIYGHYWGYYLEEVEAFQVLDVSPLATIKTLDRLYLINFIIKNISTLDVFDKFEVLRFIKSRLYDENEKTRHSIIYEIIH